VDCRLQSYGRNLILGSSKDFSSLQHPDWFRVTQPPIQWVLGAVSPGIKQTRSQADHSPPSSMESDLQSLTYFHGVEFVHYTRLTSFYTSCFTNN
jgi:hypothetical protein